MVGRGGSGMIDQCGDATCPTNASSTRSSRSGRTTSPRRRSVSRRTSDRPGPARARATRLSRARERRATTLPRQPAPRLPLSRRTLLPRASRRGTLRRGARLWRKSMMMRSRGDEERTTSRGPHGTDDARGQGQRHHLGTVSTPNARHVVLDNAWCAIHCRRYISTRRRRTSLWWIRTPLSHSRHHHCAESVRSPLYALKV